MEANFKRKEYWWEFLKEVIKEKYQNGEPLETLSRGVKNEILEVGDDFFIVRSEKRKSLDSRKITKKRVEFVLKVVIKYGYYDSKVAEKYKELLTFNDQSGIWGAHTSIIRGLLIFLPFIKKSGKSGIVFSASDYDKEKWGIDS